jgi:hypothetical protein
LTTGLGGTVAVTGAAVVDSVGDSGGEEPPFITLSGGNGEGGLVCGRVMTRDEFGVGSELAMVEPAMEVVELVEVVAVLELLS